MSENIIPTRHDFFNSQKLGEKAVANLRRPMGCYLTPLKYV